MAKRPDTQEWTRSRYWLCHFLHNRHERRKLVFPAPEIAQTPPPLQHWLAQQRLAATDHRHRQWMLSLAANSLGHDPAFIQSLRLLVREEQYHDQVLAKWLGAAAPGPGPSPAPISAPMQAWHALRRTLGLRFELSILWMLGLVRLCLLQRSTQHAPQHLHREAAAQLIHDQQEHLHFIEEWLAMEFADFNFIRRNLRRLRLQLMLIALTFLLPLQHPKLLASLGWSLRDWTLVMWGQYLTRVERLVPYRRDALLKLMLNQREHPYDTPQVLAKL